MVLDVVTIRLESETIAALDAEAEALGVPRSAYIRMLIRQRAAIPTAPVERADTMPTTDTHAAGERAHTPTADTPTTAPETNTTDPEPPTTAPEPNTERDAAGGSGRSGGDDPTPHAGGGEPASRAEAVERLDIPGRTDSTVAERREAVQAALAYLDAEGTTSAGDIREALYEEYPAGYASERGWWKNLMSEAFSDLRDDGYVELVNKARGRWRTVD